MITAWTKDCKSEEEKKQLETTIRNSPVVLDRLSELMQEDFDSIAKTEVGSKVYDNANWAFKQADVNGYKRCLLNYITLLTLDLKENNERIAVRPEQPGSTIS